MKMVGVVLDKLGGDHEFVGMAPERLKALLNTVPFRPFNLYLPSGHTVAVPHRDFAAMTPSGRTLVVLGENESETVVDVMLIERIELQTAA